MHLYAVAAPAMGWRAQAPLPPNLAEALQILLNILGFVKEHHITDISMRCVYHAEKAL